MTVLETAVLTERINTLRNKGSEYSSEHAEGYNWAIDDVLELIKDMSEKEAYFVSQNRIIEKEEIK